LYFYSHIVCLRVFQHIKEIGRNLEEGGYIFNKAQIQAKWRKLKSSYLAVKDNNGKTGY
jgi:hypothetical protein